MEKIDRLMERWASRKNTEQNHMQAYCSTLARWNLIYNGCEETEREENVKVFVFVRMYWLPLYSIRKQKFTYMEVDKKENRIQNFQITKRKIIQAYLLEVIFFYFCLLTPFTRFSYTLPSASGSHQSFLCIYDLALFCIVFQVQHIRVIIGYLFFFFRDYFYVK